MNAIFRRLKMFMGAAFCLAILSAGAAAQADNETESATESRLLEVTLPANAQRVLPQSVPAQITQVLEKVITGSGGKFRQGEKEVLIWGNVNSRKSEQIINQFSSSLKNAGWQFTVVGEESGVSVFKATQSSPRNRTIAGFYGATDEALIFAAIEAVPNQSLVADQTTNQSPESKLSTEKIETSATQNVSAKSNAGSVVGTWSDGYSSILSGYSPTTGPKSFTPGRSHLFKYVFHPDGTFDFTGLMQNTIYNCTTWVFNDKRGRYTIEGNQITLTKTKNFFRRTDSCSAANNMERDYTLDPETYTFSVRRNDRGKEEICLNKGDGGACYESAQE